MKVARHPSFQGCFHADQAEIYRSAMHVYVNIPCTNEALKQMYITAEPIQTDGHEVEDGGGAADDVQGDVEVAGHLGETPHPPVHLKKIFKICNVCSYMNAEIQDAQWEAYYGPVMDDGSHTPRGTHAYRESVWR